MAVVGRLIVQIAADISALKKDMQSAADEIRRGFDGIRSSAQGLAGILGVAFSADALKDFVVEAAKAEAKLNELRTVFRAVAGDANYGDAMLAWTRDLANSMGQPIEAFADLTKQMLATTAQMDNLRGEATERMIKAMAGIATAMQMGVGDVQNFGRAITQMLGKGKIMAEELFGQLAEVLPQAVPVMAQVAKELGLIDKASTQPIRDLRALMEPGKGGIPSTMMVAFLEAVNKQLGELRPDQLTGFQRELSRMANEWTMFQEGFSQSAGLETFMADLTRETAKFLASLREGLKDPNSAISTLANEFKLVGGYIKEAIGYIKDFIGLLDEINNHPWSKAFMSSANYWSNGGPFVQRTSLSEWIEKEAKNLTGNLIPPPPEEDSDPKFAQWDAWWKTVIDRITPSQEAISEIQTTTKSWWESAMDALSPPAGFKATLARDLERIGNEPMANWFKKQWADLKKVGTQLKIIGENWGVITPTVTVKPILKLEETGGAWQAKFKAMSAGVQAALQSAAQKYELPLSVLVAIAWQESGGKQYNSLGELLKNTTSGATGVMQLMPKTALSLKVDAGNLEQNVMGGAKLLRDLLDKFNGDLDKSLAAYGGFVTKDATSYINNIKSIAGVTSTAASGLQLYSKQAMDAASATQGLGRQLGEATKAAGDFMEKKIGFSDITAALSGLKIAIPAEVLNTLGLLEDKWKDVYAATKQAAEFDAPLKAQLSAAQDLNTIGQSLADIASRRAALQVDLVAGSTSAAEQDRNLAAAQAQLAANAQLVVDAYIRQRDAASGMTQVNDLLAGRAAEIQQAMQAARQQYEVELLLLQAQKAEQSGNTDLADAYRQRVVEMEAAAEAARVEIELTAELVKLRKELAQKGIENTVDWSAVEQRIKGLADMAGAAKAAQLNYSQSLEKMSKDTQTLADDLMDIAKSAASSMESAFSDFFFGIMQGDMDDLADKFKKTLDRMVADMMARQLSDYLFGDFAKTGQGGGLFGGLIEWFKRQGSGASIFDTLFGSTKSTPPQLNLGTEDIAKQATSWFESLKSLFTGGFGSFFGWLGSTITSLFSGLSSTLSGLLNSLTGLFSGAGGGGLFSGIGSLFSSLFSGIGSFFSGLFGFHQGGPVQAVAANVIPFPQKFHSGGPVSPVRAIAEVIPFPKLHNGGGATGLKSDELVAILQKRELVLTETQQRAVREMIDPARITTPEQRQVLEWLPKYHSGGRVNQPITKPITRPPEFHQGGPVSPLRTVADVVPFPKLHNGGAAAGLKPDELVAVLQHRELVLTEEQQKAARSMIDPAKAITGEQQQVLKWLPEFHQEGPAYPAQMLASVIPFPKLHAGGSATGLKPDELVAVLRERELVLTESQQRAVRGMIDPAKAATADQKQILEWLPRFHAGGMVADTARVGYVAPIGTDAEHYTPTATRQWGEGASAGNTSVVVNINTPDANSFRRSESQIAAQMSRAIATAGRRNR